MQMSRHRPAPPLDRYVHCFWVSSRDEPQRDGEHLLPSGGAQLLFALHESTYSYRPSASEDWSAWSGSVVHGPQSGYYLAGPKPAGGIVGVSFRPGAAAAVLGVPMAEVADRHVGLEAIWGTRGVDLRHELMSAAPRDRFPILERALSARIRRPLLVHPAVAQALTPGPAGRSPARVAEVQRASGYSPRHFIALFRSAVGLNPKHYYRIRRFNSIVRAMAAGDRRGLGDIAAAAGYSDQAHLNREFREFAGVAPTGYRPSAPDRPLHHRLATAPLPTRRVKNLQDSRAVRIQH